MQEEHTFTQENNHLIGAPQTVIVEEWFGIITNPGWGPLEYQDHAENMQWIIQNGVPITLEELSSTQRSEIGKVFINPLLLSDTNLEATFGHDNRGDKLFVPGLIHCVYGAPQSMKSLFMQYQTLKSGGVYIDLEASPRQAKARLSLMRMRPLLANSWAFPETQKDLENLIKVLIECPPTLIVFDSFVHLLTKLGEEINSATGVQKVFNQLLIPLKRANHAVVVIDHSAKNHKEGNGAIGSVNKMAQVDIAFYFARTQNSKTINVVVEKDREGVYLERNISAPEDYGTLLVQSYPLEVSLIRKRLAQKVAPSINRKDSMLGIIKRNPGIYKTDLISTMTGGTSAKNALFKEIEAEGLIRVIQSERSRKMCVYLADTTEPLGEGDSIAP